MNETIKLALSEIEALYEFAKDEGEGFYQITQENSTTIVVCEESQHEKDITDYDIW